MLHHPSLNIAIQRYFEAYYNKDKTIFEDVISLNYIDRGQSAYIGSPGIGVAEAKHDNPILIPIDRK